MIRLLVVFVAGLLLTVPVWAARPLSTDDAGTLGQGAWEIEEGYELDQPSGGGANSGGFGTSVKYGLLSNLDLGIEMPYSVSSPNGIGDATVKGKIAFNDAIALGIDVKLTNADSASGLGSGYVDYGVNGIYSQGLGSATGHVNVGYTIIGQAGGATSDNNVLSYGMAIENPLNDAVNLMGEVAGSSTPSVATNPLDALVGFNWGMSDLLTLDGGVSFGLTNASSQYKTTVGATLAL
ncbi:MAG: hypothetical protein ABIH22_04560 [Candidatus Margulisiibacteriota bacterium]